MRPPEDLQVQGVLLGGFNQRLETICDLVTDIFDLDFDIAAKFLPVLFVSMCKAYRVFLGCSH
jgi:hypothetical protein